MSETRERLSPEERAGRQRQLLTVGTHLYGPSWQQALSDRLGRPGAVEGGVPRVRINQWANGAKPIPSWMMAVLATVAREGADELRRRALDLDAIAGGGSPPGDRGEPEPEPESAGEPSQESGSPLAHATEEPDFDVDAFVEAYAHVKLPRPEPEPAPEPARPSGWRSRFADEHNASWRGVNAR